MPASDYTLLAQYPKQQVVKDRNYIGLNNWSIYTATLPIPPEKPTEEWVKARVVAERIPQQPESYVQRTLSYFLQDPATQTNVRQYLNSFNDEPTETALAAQIEGVIGTFMPRFADIDVTGTQVDQWYADNGFAEPVTARNPAGILNPALRPV
jgi:hypothetical protein